MVTKDWRPFIYGGIASVTAEFSTFPIDTTKTRLQVQGQRSDARYTELKYKGMIHALIRITKEEGLQALYSGIVQLHMDQMWIENWTRFRIGLKNKIRPALLRQATYGTIKIGIYYSLKHALIRDPHEEVLVKNVICGIMAGVISSSIANPTDVLKIRMQAQNKNFSQKGMINCFLEMYKNEGVKGLWRGVGPTAQRAAVVAGVELPVYDITKKNLIRADIIGDNMLNHFFSSFVAGLTGAIASTPIDVVRTRLMNQRRVKAAIVNGAPAEVVYTSALQCAFQTVQTEGFFALYKGFVPTWVRLGPWNIIFFIIYEQLKRLY